MRSRSVATWFAIAGVVAGALVFSLQGGPDTRARPEQLADQIRCPTCAGLAVSESNSPLATLSRNEINRRVSEGQSDEEIRSYFVSRYGESALMSPERRGATLFAWLAPVLFAALAAAGVAYTVRRWKNQPLLPESSTEPSLDLTEPAADAPQPLIDLTATPPPSAVHQPETQGSTALKVEPEVETVAPEAAEVPPAPAPRPLVDKPGRTSSKKTIPVVAAVAVVFVALAVFTLTRSTEPELPQDPAALNAVANQQLADSKPADALKSYDAILAQEPNNVRALTYRGWLLRLANLPEGEVSIDRAIQVDPNYADARLFKGIILLRDRNQPDAAIKEIETYMASNPPQDTRALADQVLQDAKTQAAAQP